MQLGAICVMPHTADRPFDQEDIRLLSSLAIFAGAALTVVDARDLREQQSQRYVEFVAQVAHELRNPLAPIDNAIEATAAFCPANERALKTLEVASRQMRHLKTFVDYLLDAARMQYGRLGIRVSDTSLNDVVTDAIAALRHNIESRHHRRTVTGLKESECVRADHVRLSQIVANLLSNAARYTPLSGDIRLALPPCRGSPGASRYAPVGGQIQFLGTALVTHVAVLTAPFVRGYSPAAFADGECMSAS